METGVYVSINRDFLRKNGVILPDDYKAIGALKILNLIDKEGKPTELAKLVKEKNGLCQIIRNTYGGLIRWLGPMVANHENVYNYFVTKEGLTPEIAQDVTAFYQPFTAFNARPLFLI